MSVWRRLTALLAAAAFVATVAYAGTNVTFNGTSYTIPAVGDASWGTNVSNYLIALSTGTFQKTGGLFTLTNEANFGATYGLNSVYFKSRSVNPATGGAVRLGSGDTVNWRNAGNSADFQLGVSAGAVQFNGVGLVDLSSAQSLTTKTLIQPVIATISNAGVLTLPSGTTDNLVGRNTTDALTNKSISGSANTLTNVSLTAAVTGVLPIANGGTNAASSQAAINNISQLTTKGDILAYSGTNSTRFGVGADGTVLSALASAGSGLAWITPLTNPMTAVGDIIIGGTSGAAVRLAQGTPGQVFRMPTSGSPAWGAIPLASSAAVTGVLPAANMTPASSSTAGTISFEDAGAWTPGIAFTSGNGTASIAAVTAHYSKVGKQVMAAFNFSVTKGTGSGNLRLTGLPYASSSATAYIGMSPITQDVASLAYSAQVQSGTTNFFINTNLNAALTAASMGTTNVFQGTLSYLTD